MNIFDNIIQSSTDKFLGKAQNVPLPSAPKFNPSGYAKGYEDTVDETQTPIFKALQGAQDVFNTLPSALRKTAELDKTRALEKQAQKQKQMVDDMLKEGFSYDAIESAFKKLKDQGKFDYTPGISESIVSGLGTWAESIGQTTNRLSQIENPIERTLSGVLPYAGQAVATPLQPVTSALEPYVSPVVQKIVEKTGQTENVQNLSNQWSEFEKSNPILAENIAGLLNVSELAPVPFAKPIANATAQGAKATGKAIVRGAEVVAPKATAIIKKPVTIVKNKAVDIFGKEIRPVEDIASNILQPYKGMVENLDDATAGLRRVVEETGTSTDTFQGLLGKIEQTKEKYGQMKQESLGQITQTRKSESAQKALENLDSVYENVSSKDMLAIQARIKELSRKNMNEGLTPLEMDEVKVLHTQSNNLFNEKGQQTGGFSSDDLRGLRRDLKEEIEVFAEENGVSNIREINRVYGELSDARTLAENQVANLRAYKGRQIPPTRIQKIADFIMEFPVIKQAFSDPARILASSLFKTLRGDKINPIEVQKRLPSFLKELKDAGMKSGDLQKVEKMIQNEIKLLPAPSGKPLSAKVVNINPIEGTPKVQGEVGKQGVRPGTTNAEIIRNVFTTDEIKLLSAPKGAEINGPVITLKMSDGEVINISKESIKNAKISTTKKEEAMKLLPAPRIPVGTSLPRTDIVAESMQGLSSKVKRPNDNSNSNRVITPSNSTKIVRPTSTTTQKPLSTTTTNG